MMREGDDASLASGLRRQAALAALSHAASRDPGEHCARVMATPGSNVFRTAPRIDRRQ